uniref:designed protein OR327 n=1 Tax=synthetic construct TaxID=32630 RepID=UPI00034F232F
MGDIQVQVNIDDNGKNFDYTYTVTTESELQKVLNELMDYIKKQGAKRVRISITARSSKEAYKFLAILAKVFAELGYNDINRKMTVRFRGDDLEALEKALKEMIRQARKFAGTVTYTLDGNDLEITITGVPRQVLEELAKEAERLAKEFNITITITVTVEGQLGSLEHHHHHH